MQYEKAFLGGGKTQFTPRIMTFACPNCPDKVKKRDCISDGKYCALQPKGEVFNKDEGNIDYSKYKFENRFLLI